MADITGTNGDDEINPGQTDPNLQTTADADTVTGGEGNDTIYGGGGDDDLFGGNQNDFLDGDAGNDTISGDDGDDVLDGGDGNDTLIGGNGNDFVSGGAGDDIINNNGVSGGDQDALFGGSGNDIITAIGGGNSVYIDGGDGDDIIDAGDFSNGVVTLNLSSGVGNDTVTGFQFGVDNLYIDNIDPASITVNDLGGGGPFSNFINIFEIIVPDVGTFHITDNRTFLDINEDMVRNSFVDASGFVAPVDPVCFTTGTLIETKTGRRAIETLNTGDLVRTRDHGYQAVRFRAMRKLEATGSMAPIVISKGTLGNDRDLLVSPKHRMLVSGPRVEALFGESEMLVAARDLIDGDQIYRKEGGSVTYVHIAFDRHEIIFAEGAPSESLQPFADDAAAYGADAYEELVRIFPELASGETTSDVARPVLRSSEADLLLH